MLLDRAFDRPIDSISQRYSREAKRGLCTAYDYYPILRIQRAGTRVYAHTERAADATMITRVTVCVIFVRETHAIRVF